MGRTYRVISPEEFFETFSSDRSHMIRDGKYLATPPTYPCIQKTHSKNNLFSHFVDMKNKKIGKVINESQFVEMFQ